MSLRGYFVGLKSDLREAAHSVLRTSWQRYAHKGECGFNPRFLNVTIFLGEIFRVILKNHYPTWLQFQPKLA
jgi:hypothetical protein